MVSRYVNVSFIGEANIQSFGDSASYSEDQLPGGGGPPANNSWVTWGAVALSVLLLFLLLVYVVKRIRRPRSGYQNLEGTRRQMVAISQLLEEIRGRPRRVQPYEPLTESETHFFVHDFKDFY
ncbi:uncharacterized protein LOC121873245 [Homarus americanus]|uniref:Uncharacterized protein n=1 Tax=Homarus americanus TaxID=6706 RepID=A0A8J5JXS5_HOMAM|nr:uncharacterized protein LOC121873245 [Homarus americanus]KAG7163093.1 hypothetical protein Hamer_G002165 [Homarus americanus]